MEIYFASNKLKKACSEFTAGNREWGIQNAQRIRQRLQELRAAENLADMVSLPPAGCHELGGKRAGQFAVDCKQPYRLIFRPADPISRRVDGGIDLKTVTTIVILGVVDYHGE